MKATLRFDGGCKPTNPGHSAFASVLVDDTGRRSVIAKYLGKHTNNYAEYSGLVEGIKLSLEFRIDFLVIYTDSQLIRGHMTQNWKCKKPELRKMRDEALELLNTHYGEQGEGWDLKWQRRNNNKEADALCTRAIHHGMNKNPWRKQKVKNAGEVESIGVFPTFVQ